MRNRTLAALALAALAALPSAARAQERADQALQAAAAPAPALQADPRVATLSGDGEAAAATPVAAPAALRHAGSARAASTRRRVFLTLGGAVVGAWAGYLGSQVAKSDWEKAENGDFASYRAGFTVGGAALGAITGLLVSRDGGGGDRVSRRASAVRDVRSRETITMEEVQTSTARNALELVQALRPEWLRRRGIQSDREIGRGEQVGERGLRITPGEGGIKVYLDNALVGDEVTLREIPLTNLTGARFLDAAAATYRFGSGHTHGAIVLSTSNSNP